MLELVKIYRQKVLLCMHENVNDLIESALNSKLLSINSQCLDKKEQEVKNVVEQPVERGNRSIKSLQNFRVIRKSSTFLKDTSQISLVHAIAPILSTEEPEHSLSMGKLIEAEFSKWSRALCPTTRYNYMTSNSVESVNALTKDMQKLPVMMLMDWFRDLRQKWYYERRVKHQDAPNDELTEWATTKVKRRMLKNANWMVKGVHENKV
nr:transposase, MuDR, MULE transposase domain protein [Tanacetum cinerariifolium]